MAMVNYIKNCFCIRLKDLPEDLYDAVAYSIFSVGAEIHRTGAVITPESLKLYMGEFPTEIEDMLKEIYNRAIENNVDLIVFY